MFDPLLELQQRRRRMMGVPQVQGNVLPPDVGPDMQAAPVQAPTPMVMQPVPMQPDPQFGALAQLGAERGMNLLTKKLQKPVDAEAGQKALSGLPVFKNLFHR